MLSKHEARELKRTREQIPALEQELDDNIRDAILAAEVSASVRCPSQQIALVLQRKYQGHYGTKVEYYERDRAYDPENYWILTVTLNDL